MATTHERQESPEYSVFREHYDKLYHAIQDPLPLAVRLYSTGIISSAVMGHMSVVGLSTLEKNNTLLSAVEKQIQVVPQAFHEVLSVLNEEPYMQSLVETMQSKFSTVCDRIKYLDYHRLSPFLKNDSDKTT